MLGLPDLPRQFASRRLKTTGIDPVDLEPPSESPLALAVDRTALHLHALRHPEKSPPLSREPLRSALSVLVQAQHAI